MDTSIDEWRDNERKSPGCGQQSPGAQQQPNVFVEFSLEHLYEYCCTKLAGTVVLSGEYQQNTGYTGTVRACVPSKNMRSLFRSFEVVKVINFGFDLCRLRVVFHQK
jgi:hypothetical protein